MRRIFGSRRSESVLTVSILVIVLALTAGMLGCDGTQYDLTISSTEGGEVTTPGEGAFTYDEVTIVDLVAESDDGYCFAKWTGNVSAIGDVNASETTITMHDSYYITANFEELDPGTLFAGGNGTEENPYQIANWHHLSNIRDYLNNHFILINDLKSTTAGYWELASPTANGEKGWQPIGNWDSQFTGVFDGQGHEIKNLFINRPEEGGIGLFASIRKIGAVIKNIGVVDAEVTGWDTSGSLVGCNDMGTIDNCYATGSVTGDVEAIAMGGLVGTNLGGTVINCYATSSVAGGWQYGDCIGGLVGLNEYGILSDCYATGSVTGVSGGVGGLVGLNNADSTVSNCYATGSVISDGEATNIGGLAGINFGTVSDCYATGSVTGGWVRGEAIGGLVGGTGTLWTMTISNSYYNYDTVLINGEKIITIGALFDEDFEEWLANGKFLDVNERLSEEDGYYTINNVNDFRQLLAFGQNGALKFRLTSDLDLASEPGFYIPYLAGEFDGNNHKTFNLSIGFDFLSNVGLFGYLADGASVTRLDVESVIINGAAHVGGVIGGLNKGTVSNCHASGSVTGRLSVGGLVGYNYYGTVSNSSSAANVISAGPYGDGFGVGSLMGENNEGTVTDCYSTGSATGKDGVGGLAGWNTGIVTNSYSTGWVNGDSSVGGLIGSSIGIVSNSYSAGSVTGEANVGGLVGDNLHTVNNSHSSASVTGNKYIGGLAGANNGDVSNSYSTGSVNGKESVGGLVGRNLDTVNNSYSTSLVAGDDIYVGGLVGFNGRTSTVSNSYSAGSATGYEKVGGLVGENYYGIGNKSYSTADVTGDRWVGGLVGDNSGYSIGGVESVISNSYSTGSVTGNDYVGGLVGHDFGTVSDSFWDTETSGQSTSDGGTGKTTAEMQDIATFSGAAWDIVAVGSSSERNPAYIWNIVNNITYPFLSWQAI